MKLSHLKWLPLLLIAVGTAACSGCSAINPFAAAHGLDEQAYALIGTYDVAQRQLEKIAADTTLPPAVRLGAADVSKVATPVFVNLDAAVAAYEDAKFQLDSGIGTEAKVMIALSNANSWVTKAKAIFKDVEKAVSDAAKAIKSRQAKASTMTPFHIRAYGSA